MSAFLPLVLAVAAALPGFKRVGSDELFPVSTDIRWEIREDRFFFRAETEMPPEGLLKRVDRRADGVSRFVTIDDCYAFGFPTRFAVNARGATTARIDGLETASVETNGLWKFSLSVPLASVGGFPKDGALKVVRNFARADRTTGSRASVTLRRGREGDPVISGCSFGKGGNGYYPVSIDVTNPGKEKRVLSLSFVGTPVNSQPCEILKEFTLGAGESRSFEAKGPVLDDEKVNWKLTLAEKRDEGILFSDRGVFSPNFRGSPFVRPADLSERIGLRLSYFPSYNKLRVRIDAAQLSNRSGAKLSVLAGATDEVLAEWEPTFDAQGLTDETRTIPDLRPVTLKNGNPDYVLVFRAADGTEVRRIFKRFAMDWEGNKIGMSDLVVPPFTPVKRERVGQRSEIEGQRSEARGQTAGEKKVGVGVGVGDGVGVGGAAGCRTYVGEASCLPTELEKISVILRDHIVDKKMGLWQQVTAAGKELLARPMALVDATSVRFPVDAVAHRVDKDGKNPSLTRRASASTEWDYDGLCEWKLTLLPGHHEPMSLEIPLKASEAWLMHSCVDGLRANYGGVVPPGEGCVWDSSMQKGRIGLLGDYLPYLWVGGTLRGIAVFGENDKGWVLGREQKVGGESRSTEEGKVPLSTSTSSLLSYSPPCQEILREPDGTVVIRLNLVQRAIDLTEPRTIRIGFMATPVKPMPENWRSRSIGRVVGATKYWGGLEGVATSDETDLFLRKFAEARKTGKVDRAFLADYLEHHVPFKGVKGSLEYRQDRENMRAHHEAGMHVAAMSARNPGSKIVFYTNARGVEYGNASGLTYMDEWSRVEWKDRDVGRRELREYELDPVASYRDYAASWYYHIFATGAADALYWDCVYCSPNYDLVGTDAYVLPDGRIQPSTGIFNLRALIRRCAVTQVELGRDPRDNWVHMTNAELAPVCAFAGVNLDWEDIYGNKPFQERYPREMILACSIGRQMGNRVAVLGYFAEMDPASPLLQSLERGGTGVCLAYELDWSRVKVWREAMKRLEDWGYRKSDTRVWNYWDEDVAFPVRIDGPANAALAMARAGAEAGGQRSKSAALVVVSDFGGGGEYAIRPDAAALGVRADFTASDFETGKPLPVADGAVRVKIGKYDYAIVEVK